MIALKRSCPAGFTIVELLIVLAIIGLITGLSLAGIQRARQTASRTVCASNLRQIGLALLQHHDSLGVLPSNGGWDVKQTIQAVDGSLFVPSTFDKTLMGTFSWGVGDPQRTGTKQTGSWAYAILPYLEQESMYRQRRWTEPVKLYVCPTRRPAESHPVVPEDSYGKYEGGGWTWGKLDYAANGLVVPNMPRCRRIAEVLDGTSQTILVGEKAFDPQVETVTSWYWDEPFFLGGSGSTSRSGIEVLRDGSPINYKGNWGSAHSGGALFLFVDGSVRLIPHGTKWSSQLALLTPDGGEVIFE